jgi:Pyruvate/2-oxoacid:ferredoxin oxidoreductase gamma subunit
MADELGNTRVANMLVIGAYVGYTGLLSKEVLYEALKSAVKHKRFMEINIRAIDTGYEYGVKHKKTTS